MADDLPLWSRLLLYGGVAVGGLWIVYSVITSVILGPVNTYKEMWTKQYDALARKMANYTVANPNGFTQSQQDNITQEEHILDQTANGLAAASNGVYSMVEIIAAVLGAIGVSGIIISKVINKFLTNSGGQARTAAAASYIAVTTFAEQMAEGGYPTEAANLMASSQTMFETIDVPYMQNAINTITALLPSLTGIQLIVAQQQIEALTVEMSVIRTLLATPLPF